MYDHYTGWMNYRKAPPPYLKGRHLIQLPDKFSHDDENKNIWLFNVKEDPLEQDDLSGKMPNKVIVVHSVFGGK